MLQYLDTVIAFVVILLGVSLLITILNQMISALFGYRGTNLLWGVRTLLSTIEPGLASDAERIVTEVLTTPIISDSIFSRFVRNIPILGWFTNRWKLSTAITPQELVRGLSNVAQTMAATSQGRTTANLVNQLLGQVNPEPGRNARMIFDTLQNVSPNTANQMDRLVQELGTKMQGSVGNVEAWFDNVMKRTSQRFTSQMRIWTILFAVVIAFGACLDSFTIIRQLWTSPELRASLVSDRETILKEASVVLSVQRGTAQGAGPGVPPQILGDAMRTLISIEKEAAGEISIPPEFKDLDNAVNWLKNLKGDQKKLAADYRNLVLTELKTHADNIQMELKKAGFQLQVLKWEEFKKLFINERKKLIGILVTAGLLSLGAPFWFNVLKSLSNLRPLVAKSSGNTATEPTQS